MEDRFRSIKILPCERLARYINCYYVYKDDGLFKNVRVHILNNGYTEMLFQLGDITEFCNFDKGVRNRYKISLSGQYLDKIITVPKGKTHIISVNFKPGGMYGIFGIPQNYFTSSNIALSDVDPLGSRFLWEQLTEKTDTKKQINCIEAYLVQKMDKNKYPVLEMQHAVSIIAQKKGVICIHSVAEMLRLSVRTFNRRFYTQVGITPKQLSEIYRVNGVCDLILKNYQTDILDIALNSGYYDSSHLNRAFKNYLHITPSELCKKALPFGGYCDKITIIDTDISEKN
ncbi:MAG: AraC family transcriptional regulator [Bacteroidales bacterium]|nr:AraC family transcriptional regulator [Bacteroidales bacterium]